MRARVLNSVDDLPNDLYRKSGAYVITSHAGRVLYVGESHTDQLKKTILRHFERWTSGTWKGEHKRHTYDRKKTSVLCFCHSGERGDCKAKRANLRTHPAGQLDRLRG